MISFTFLCWICVLDFPFQSIPDYYSGPSRVHRSHFSFLNHTGCHISFHFRSKTFGLPTCTFFQFLSVPRSNRDKSALQNLEPHFLDVISYSRNWTQPVDCTLCGVFFPATRTPFFVLFLSMRSGFAAKLHAGASSLPLLLYSFLMHLLLYLTNYLSEVYQDLNPDLSGCQEGRGDAEWWICAGTWSKGLFFFLFILEISLS